MHDFCRTDPHPPCESLIPADMVERGALPVRPARRSQGPAGPGRGAAARTRQRRHRLGWSPASRRPAPGCWPTPASAPTGSAIPTPPPGPSPQQVETREDGMFVFMDPPEHTRLRKLLTGQFTVRRMRALEERIREIAVDQHRGDEGEAAPRPTWCPPTRCRSRRWSSARCSASTYADRGRFQRNTALALNSTTPPDERAPAGLELYTFIRGAGRGQAGRAGRRHDLGPARPARRPARRRVPGAARRGPRDHRQHAGA